MRERLVYIIPGLSAYSLKSVVTLCNVGCEVTFTKINVKVKHRGKTIMMGKKYTRTGLWMIALDPTTYPTLEPSHNTANALHSLPHQQDMENSMQASTTRIVLSQTTNDMVQTLDTSSKEELSKYHRHFLGLPLSLTLFCVLNKHPDELATFSRVTRDE